MIWKLNLWEVTLCKVTSFIPEGQRWNYQFQIRAGGRSFMILVVGGAGYIGSHTVKKLVRAGEEVVVFDNLSTGHRELVVDGAIFLQGDLGNVEEIEVVFKRYIIDAVIHFAASAYVGESVEKPAKYYNNNIINTIHLLDTIVKYQVKSIVFSSTCATYGIPNEVPITESHPQNPINPYGRTKWFIEQILEDYRKAYGINYVALRYFNAAGADPELETGEWHNPETHLIPLIFDAAIGKREAINVYGNNYDTPDGTCVRDYIHVNDLADAHIKAIQYMQTSKTSNMFNLGNGSGYSVLEMIESVKHITKRPISIIYEKRRPGDPDELIGSTDKAKELLGWEPRYTGIDQIIESAWNWYCKLEDIGETS